MYNQITANKRKTWLLIIIFTAFILALGWTLDYVAGGGYERLVFAAIISLVMATFSYYRGDKVALWTAGAKAITKEENPYLYRLVENLCIASGLALPKIHIISDPAINAFATGRDPAHASIAVTTGAIEKLENEELEGVLAHELSHIKNYDIRVMTVVIVLVGIVSLLADWMLRTHFFGGRRDRDRSVHPIFLILGLVLIILSPIFARLIQFAVSRRREYLADADGALLTRYPAGLANALEKIKLFNQPMTRANSATAHLYISNPFGATKKFMTGLFSTHPPLDDRIKALHEMVT